MQQITLTDEEVRAKYEELKKKHHAMIKLVFDMRNEQNLYFQHRSSIHLEKAKKLEKRVDAKIIEYGQGVIDEQTKPNTLF